MAGGSAVEQLREKLPWILRGGALLGTGATVGLALGIALGMPGMIGGAPDKRVRTRKPAPALAARAPTPTPIPEVEPAPTGSAAAVQPGGAAPAPTQAAAAPAPTAGPALGPTAAPNPVPGGVPPGPGGQVIQVAATPFRPLADAVRKRLTDVGYQSYVDTVVLEGRQRFRVRVDSAGRDTAAVAAELKALGYPVWVTQE